MSRADAPLTPAERTVALRCSLMCEELGETLDALGDEASTLDGLCDLVYVAIGTALQLDLPITEAFVAVHAANMKKQTCKQSSDQRLHDKGPGWQSPDIDAVIAEHRRRCNANVHG